MKSKSASYVGLPVSPIMFNVSAQPRIRTLQQNETYGKFAIDPLDKGYGHTLGASLRRVLLTSIEGIAVTSIQVQGVQHEFSTLPGVVEDMVDIILNLKELSLQSQIGTLKEPLTARIDKQGEGRVTAADIQLPSEIKAISPEKVICNLSRADARFDAVLTIESGKGYVPATSHPRSDTIGTIPVDALFSPIVRVNYFVEPTRVGQQTELDRLVVEITTDGSLQPAAALSQAAGILIGYLQLFRAEGAADAILFEEGQEPTVRSREIKLDDLDFSNRTYNCLKRQGVTTLEELCNQTEEELSSIRNFGKKSMEEVMAKLSQYKVSLREESIEPEDLEV